MLRALIAKQVQLGHRFDRWLPAVFSQDGQEHYIGSIVPPMFQSGTRVYDVGGGKRPFLSPAKRRELHASVVGIDIDADELANAPDGSYDRIITSDIAKFRGNGDADLLVCQAVFEHVRDVDGATEALATILKPGGQAALFVPCRNALFARLNLFLPESVKRAVLFTVFPGTKKYQGFRSYYDHCTPSGIASLASKHGLEVERTETYWMSGYFYAFLPAYFIWRLWTILARTFHLDDCCETFAVVLRKPS